MRGITPIEKKWMQQGEEFHQYIDLLNKRRNLSQYGLNGEFKLLSSLSLNSEALGLHGICDAVLVVNKIQFYPIEYKLQENISHIKGIQIQLVAYAMLVEEKFQTNVKKAFLLYGKKGKTYPIKLTSSLRADVKQIADNIKRDCVNCILPNSTATDAQCGQCEFLNFCADRL